MASSLRPSTIIAATVGTAAAAFIGYAIYFDHRRRTDSEFRKALKRDAKREARIAKTQQDAQGQEQRAQIRAMIQEAKEEGFPSNPQEMEGYFMEHVAQGERLQNDDLLESAFCFYKALKVYTHQQDLMQIYDKTVPKPVIDILAEMIAVDGTIRTGSGPNSASGSIHGIDD